MYRFEQFLETAEPNGQIVQLYKSDERILASNVRWYLLNGLKRGDGLLVIASRDHTEAFFKELRQLGADPQPAVREDRLVFREAGEALARFMVAGKGLLAEDFAATS